MTRAPLSPRRIFLHEGGTLGVAMFIGAAMLVMIVAVGAFGPRTRNRRLEDLSR